MNWPQRLGDISFLGSKEAPQSYFLPWASANRFEYPAAAQEFFSKCGSAAEAHFIRPFALREGVTFAGPVATAGEFSLTLQKHCAGYWIDAVVADSESILAVEIDGEVWHHVTEAQRIADYTRQRRIVLRGYTVVRFTAREAMTDADECWRQLELILAARRGE